MTQINNSFQALKIGGTSHPNSETKSLSTPRQEWLKKEKELKVKFYILFFLSHMLWPLALYTQDTPDVPAISVQSIEKGHYMIQVPAQVLTTSPAQGEKIAVSVVYNNKIIFKNAYLHETLNSQTSPTGVSAKLEIPQSQVYLLKNLKQKILEVLPPINTFHTTTQKKKRGPHEITI
jgi:hypothetical protein